VPEPVTFALPAAVPVEFTVTLPFARVEELKFASA